MVEIDKEFECSICLDVIDPPVATPCGHTFCKHCIKATGRVMVYNKNIDYCKCPECNEYFEPSELVDFLTHPLTRPQKNRLMVTIVGCKNAEKGCDWEGQYEKRSTHMEKCGYNKIVCKHCRVDVFLKDVEKHSPQVEALPFVTCWHQIVKCVNNGCGWSGKYKDCTNHSWICPFKLSKCKWCNKEWQRQHLEEHEYRCPGKVEACMKEVDLLWKNARSLETDVSTIKNGSSESNVKTLADEVQRIVTENVHFHELDKKRQAEIQNLQTEVDTLKAQVGSLLEDKQDLVQVVSDLLEAIQSVGKDIGLPKQCFEKEMRDREKERTQSAEQIRNLKTEIDQLKTKIEMADTSSKVLDQINIQIAFLHKQNAQLRLDFDKSDIKRTTEQLEIMQLTDVPDSDPSDG